MKILLKIAIIIVKSIYLSKGGNLYERFKEASAASPVTRASWL